MNVSGPESPVRSKAKKRLRILLCVLAVMSVAHLIGLNVVTLPNLFRGGWGAALPAWVTEAKVLNAVQESKIPLLVTNEANGIVFLKPREGRISALAFSARDDATMHVEFDLELEGNRYHIDGHCYYHVVSGDGGSIHEEVIDQFDGRADLKP